MIAYTEFIIERATQHTCINSNSQHAYTINSNSLLSQVKISLNTKEVPLLLMYSVDYYLSN